EPILLTTLYQAFWSKFFGLKHVIFTWENISYDNKFKGPNLLFKKIIIKLNLLLSDGIICGNRKAEAIFKQLTSKPIAAIPLSGVDADFFHKVNADNFLENHGLKEKFVFSFAGAIGYRKGIHNLIRAFKKTLFLLPNAHLVIAGTGEYDKDISELITELGLGGNITRIPWLNPAGLRELLSASHVFLYPSISYGGWEEQFGYSMAEASLVELPVISTSSGSIGDVVIDGETGLLVKPDDEIGLEEAMIKLGLDRELRIKMGQAGRQYVIDNFAYKIIAGKFYEFFKKINLSSQS
ncbi:MAG: glycosyltransferase family 4 protein, partial [Patescibacteria group bacterium]